MVIIILGSNLFNLLWACFTKNNNNKVLQPILVRPLFNSVIFYLLDYLKSVMTPNSVIVQTPNLNR